MLSLASLTSAKASEHVLIRRCAPAADAKSSPPSGSIAHREVPDIQLFINLKRKHISGEAIGIAICYFDKHIRADMVDYCERNTFIRRFYSFKSINQIRLLLLKEYKEYKVKVKIHVHEDIERAL